MKSSIILKIDSIAYGGNGVGRHEGIVHFVPGVLPGETVLVRPTQKKKTYVIAHPEKIIKSSPNRVIPHCQYALQISPEQHVYCPGCQYQHMSYNDELCIKNKQFGDLLERIAKLNPNLIKPPVASPKSYAYRNKIILHSLIKNNTCKYGYYTIDNKSLIEIKNCPLACDDINKLLKDINPKKLASPPATTTLTLRYTENDNAKYWIKPTVNDFTIQNQSTENNLLLQESSSFGKFYVPRDSFFQINIHLRNALIQETLNILKENPTQYIFDLFCGVGVFGICAAKITSKKVYASDIDNNAINTAKANADFHNIKDIKFLSMSALKAAHKVFREIKSKDVTLIIDPPRTGLNKKLTKDIAEIHRPKNIIYISCAADTLCRDIKKFSEAGYSVEHSRLFDMFPRTSHFETITFLTLNT